MINVNKNMMGSMPGGQDTASMAMQEALRANPFAQSNNFIAPGQQNVGASVFQPGMSSLAVDPLLLTRKY